MSEATGAGFLDTPTPTPEVQAMYDGDVENIGFVMNLSRLWGHLPAAHQALMQTMGVAAESAGLTVRQRGVLVTATASTIGDSYCSLAWGLKMGAVMGEDLVGAVLRGDHALLDDRERALATWAGRVARSPGTTTAGDVEELREAGFDDAQILGITAFVAARMAFSTVNAALGAQPDRELGEQVAAPVRDAVDYGRPTWAGPGA